MTASPSDPRFTSLPDLEDVEAERGRRSLRYYLRAAWPSIEPHPFVPGWHIDAITDHLEAVERGEIRKLLINIPPRHGKSNITCVFFPTWAWTRQPASRWLTTSYIESLTVRDCVRARRLMQSPWYQRRWGQGWRFTGDQNEKTRYENDCTGFRVAYSVGGATGEGGDFIIVDDPHNVDPRQAESPKKREGVLVWWDEVISTRLNDPKTSARIIIMQRVHEHDLSGHVLQQGGYEHLCLPAEYAGKVYVTVLGNLDPRHAAGELLWPARFGPKEIAGLKKELGPHATAGQLQQEPVARQGGHFERGWFETVDAAPRKALRGRYWDKAATPGGGKFSAGVRMALADGIAYVEDVTRGQWSAGVREATIRQVADADCRGFARHQHDRTQVLIWMEQEPGGSGKESAESSIRGLAGYRAYADRPTGDKFTRAMPLAAAAEAGNVKLVRGEWNDDFVAELEAAGPGAAYLDQMDAASGAYNMLTSGKFKPPALDDLTLVSMSQPRHYHVE